MDFHSQSCFDKSDKTPRSPHGKSNNNLASQIEEFESQNLLAASNGIEDFESQDILDPSVEDEFDTAGDRLLSDFNSQNSIIGNKNPYMSSENPLSQSNRKRKTTNTENSIPKRVKPSIAQQLKSIDPEEELDIHDMLDQLSNDVLVEEYVNLLLKHKIRPVLLETTIDEWLSSSKDIELQIEDFKDVFSDLFSHFQLKYFISNLKKAVQFESHVCNPLIDLRIPKFNLLPRRTLQLMTNLKMGFTTHYEKVSIIGASFSCQLILLRIIDSIMSQVNFKYPDTNQRKTFEGIFSILYRKARIEFIKEYKPKVINWEFRKSKVIHSEPKWRKNQEEPPTNSFNRFANNIFSGIANQQPILKGSVVESEVKDFLQGTIPASNHKTHNKRHQQYKSNFRNKKKHHQRPSPISANSPNAASSSETVQQISSTKNNENRFQYKRNVANNEERKEITRENNGKRNNPPASQTNDTF